MVVSSIHVYATYVPYMIDTLDVLYTQIYVYILLSKYIYIYTHILTGYAHCIYELPKLSQLRCFETILFPQSKTMTIFVGERGPPCFKIALGN